MLDLEQTEDVGTLLSAGREAAQRGDKTTARNALRKANRLAPNDVPVLIALAEVVGTFNERRLLLEQALQLEPDNIAAQGALAALKSGAANPHPAVNLPPIDPTPLMAPTSETLYCYRHPTVETGLRCIQCARPICSKCSERTPVGFICPECRKERRSPMYQVEPLDAVKAGAISLVLGGVGAYLLSPFGIFLFFLMGGVIGEMIMRAIDWATRKRGLIMQIAAAGSFAVGAILAAVFAVGFKIGLILFLGFGVFIIVARLR
ncbi:MAG TPA: DUF456 domain-containing protein [Herpetosiphon sp.]|uniref:Uncharacterized protein n=1 Tax=Herpetosiphon aurantiacus (strain ATCC 23779 / DSM 785 / 114-95) TaxID=316274 RepID=A9B628_HERA2|nr:DUF456 domain-containing protein [Herpetosiphon sp.]ABX05821.1 conserved hypothetical protein [Herpetosiphon aurantiacus DSM 785]HBW48748.1 DUF456 domain-containing protein [Herpetosiphon sp.]